ncbi:ATP-dependent zinc metalloprotease FtsH 3-like [Zophobas morio]|uniref:ATP-dependent zinc metalloprotease FtsH 3-like n=1 Tax=Zophobas morio TaxID=2755281 RepID=UPI003083BF5E
MLGLVCFNEETNISSETKKVIDSEIKALCQSAYEKAKNIIKSNERQLHLIAEALLDKETLSAEELYRVVGLKNPKVKANA